MLSRRELFQLGLLAGLTGLSSCGREINAPVLRASLETLPKAWLDLLPKPWAFKPLEAKSVLNSSDLVLAANTDLLAIGDGWISGLATGILQPIGAGETFSRLNNQANEFLKGFHSDLFSRILPIGLSPWVMLFRNGKEWFPRAKEGWNVLLDQSLAGHVVLPASPRIVMSIADRISEPDALRKLRSQALTFDDRNSLNWLLAGKARVAILPLYRCFRSLSRDPRLSIAIPQSGTPLHWTVLVRPGKANEPLPTDWLEKAWEMPLLGELISRGWMPPLPHSELLHAMQNVPDVYKPLLLPPESFWKECWSLPTLTPFESNRLEQRWVQSIP